MAIYLMDKSYRITTSGGVTAGKAVIAGAATGQCALPAAANAGKLLGITTTSQPVQNAAVSVRKAGIAEVVAAGIINPGDPVNIADTQGRIKAINETPGTKVQCLGFAETSATSAGDIVEVFIAIHERTT